MKADKRKIEKLLSDPSVSRYRIWKDTGIAQSTLSDIATGKTKIENIRFELAAQLTRYYDNKERMK